MHDEDIAVAGDVDFVFPADVCGAAIRHHGTAAELAVFICQEGAGVDEAQTVELRCKRDILEQVADRFGENVFIRNVTDTHFDLGVDAVVSEALVTWLTNYGDGIEVLSPKTLRDMIKNRAEKILSLYK